MVRAVLDASAAVLLLTTPESRTAAERIGAFSSLHAPEHFLVECVAALRGMWLGGLLSHTSFRALARDAGDLPIVRHRVGPLVERMVSLAPNVTAYDAAYLVLAEGLEAPLITTDARLARVPGSTCEVMVL